MADKHKPTSLDEADVPSIPKPLEHVASVAYLDFAHMTFLDDVVAFVPRAMRECCYPGASCGNVPPAAE